MSVVLTVSRVLLSLEGLGRDDSLKDGGDGGTGGGHQVRLAENQFQGFVTILRVWQGQVLRSWGEDRRIAAAPAEG